MEVEEWNRVLRGRKGMSFGKRPGPKPTEGRERRRHRRRPISGPAEIIIPANWEVIPCEIVDVSMSGAQLAVASVLGIPSNFILRLPTGQEIDVEVVRRTPRKLGIKYVRNSPA